MEELLERVSLEVKNLKPFAKGWRGLIFVGEYEGLKVAVKLAKGRDKVRAINKEADILQKLKGIEYFPQLVLRGDGYLGYKFIEGETFGKFLKGAGRIQRLQAYRQILEAAYILDGMGINRDEFSNLYKNVLIDGKGKVYVLDFERGAFKDRPTNLTQLLQLFVREGLIPLERAVELGKDYRNNPQGVYNEILEIIEASL